MDYAKIINEANLAGLKAGHECVPQPMKICGEVITDGVCGFAWLSMKAIGANKGFINYAKKEGIVSKSVMGGFMLWISDFGQSMERKLAYAKAFNEVLKANGINAQVHSRID